MPLTHKLLIATGNRDKLVEIREILSGIPFEVISLQEFPDLPEVVEDRDTIEGNAMKKALETSRATGLLCLADDTGLFIETLQGEPGVYSARWAGEGCSYRDNRVKALQRLQGIANRKAEFRTAVALAAPDGIISVQTGRVPGMIATEERGENGFGYDSVFIVESMGQTYAELADSVKNRISHRALALDLILPILRKLTN